MSAEKGAARFVEICPCTRNDLNDVREILAGAPEAARWSIDALREMVESQPACFLIAKSSDEVCGFVLSRRIDEEGEILNLAVKPPYRRAGIATALVRELFGTLAREGVKRVFLEVRAGNHVAIAFYQGLGFSQIGKRPRYYSNPTEDALILRADLHGRV
jgi:[ribosomal protein S18]-alanine N-acetyltransferase